MGPTVQALAYSVACVGVSAFSGGLIDAAKAEEVMNILRTLTEESQQVSTRQCCVWWEEEKTFVLVDKVWAPP